MNDQQTDTPANKTDADKHFRPALITSWRTLHEYSTFLDHLLVGLTAQAVNAAVVCPPDSRTHTPISPSVEVIRHPAYDLPFFTHYNKRILLEKLKKFDPTVLHCLCQSQALLVRHLARHLDIPYVLTVDSLQKRWGQLSISSKRLARIIVPAASIKDNLERFYPRISDRIEQINFGTFTSPEIHCFDQPRRMATVVIAGPMEKADELANVLEAVKNLAIAGYEFMLVMIGTGRDEKNVRRMLSARGLLEMTVIVPTRAPVRAVLAAGDIFVQPQPAENFTPMLLEAMSVGTAVAVCKGGVDDFIIENETAAVFDPDDELSVRTCLQKLFDTPESARQLASSAQRYIKENHSVTEMVTEIVNIYRHPGLRDEPAAPDTDSADLTQ